MGQPPGGPVKKIPGVWLVTASVVGAVLLLAAIAIRGVPELTVKTAAPHPRAPEIEPNEPAPVARLSPTPEAPVETAASARLRTTYENYRSAVAVGNRHLQDALKPTLLREKATALRFAREDLAASTDPAQRDIAVRTAESLRR